MRTYFEAPPALVLSHLFLEHITDDVANLLKAGGVSENLLLAGLDDAVYGFKDPHHNLALLLFPNRFQKAWKHHIQQLQQGWRKQQIKRMKADNRAYNGTQF